MSKDGIETELEKLRAEVARLKVELAMEQDGIDPELATLRAENARLNAELAMARQTLAAMEITLDATQSDDTRPDATPVLDVLYRHCISQHNATAAFFQTFNPLVQGLQK